MVLPGTDGLLSKAQFPTSMISELQRYLNPERGERESFLIDLYTGMISPQMGVGD